MNNRKLQIDTKKMLGFRLLKESTKTTSNQIIGSKVGGKARKPISSLIGAKTGAKPAKPVSSIIGSKVGTKPV